MLGIIFLLVAFYLGILATTFLKGLTWLERALLGIVVGIITGAVATFLVFLAIGSLDIAFWVAFAVLIVVSALLTRRFGITRSLLKSRYSKVSRLLKRNRGPVVFFAALAIFFTLFFFLDPDRHK